LKHFSKPFIREYTACVLLKYLFNQPVNFRYPLCAVLNRLLKLLVFFPPHGVVFLCQQIQEYRLIAADKIG
jgi:hypothetical protein